MSAGLRARILLLPAAAIVLVAGITAANGLRSAPRLGLLLEMNTGRVIAIESGSVAAGAGIHTGDQITAIGGAPVDGKPSVIDNLVPVSTRQHGAIGVRWLAAPAGRLFWPGDLLLIVAAIFWLSGVLAALLGPGEAARYLFALFALLVSLALVCGYALDPPVTMLRHLAAPAIFGAMITYIWLQRALARQPLRMDSARAAVVLSAQAALMALIVDAGPALFGAASGPYLTAVGALDVLILLVAAHLAALVTRDDGNPAPVRRRLRLALLIAIVAWLPAILLGWAPLIAGLLDHGYSSPWSPYIGAISLLTLAIAYPAIVARGDLFVLELAARRLAASSIAAVILLSIAFGALRAVDQWFGPQGNDRLAIAIAFVLLTVPAFDPLRRLLQRLLEHRLGAVEAAYGGSLQVIGDRLLQALDEPSIAAALTGYAPALLGVTSIGAWLRGSDGRWLRFPLNGTAAHAVDGLGENTGPMLIGASTSLETVSSRPPDLPSIDQPFAPAPTGAMEGVALCVPVCIGDKPRGLLLLGPRLSQDPYRRPEREALVLLGKQVAAALLFVDQLAELRRRNAELASLTSRLARAREEERKHLSHELHDAVAQDLVAITRQLRRHQSGTVSEPIWQDMMAQAQEALTAIRRICNDLRPAILDMGLTSALRELVDRASSAPKPLTARLDIQGVELRLSEEREFALYRVSQEALTNVVKHAEASEVTISICYTRDAAEIEIADNGRGFTAPQRLEDIGGDHLGLLGMRERLADLGGTVRVESRPGQGTRVSARIPAAI